MSVSKKVIKSWEEKDVDYLQELLEANSKQIMSLVEQQKNNIAVDYEELNSRLYEIAGFIVIEQIEQDEKSNEYYEKIIEKINSYNEYINYYLEKYNKYNITIPQKLEKFQLLYYNYADNTVYWKDDTPFKLN